MTDAFLVTSANKNDVLQMMPNDTLNARYYQTAYGEDAFLLPQPNPPPQEPFPVINFVPSSLSCCHLLFHCPVPRENCSVLLDLQF